MVPKLRRNRLEMAYSSWEPGPDSPHVIYANLEFDGSAAPKGSRHLLQYLDWLLPSWTKEKTLRYLKEHQAEFRKCLDWLSADSRVDFGPIKHEDDNGWFRELWEQKAEVKFLQQHGLDHGGVTLAPRSTDPIYPYEGLELDQKKALDPLDPICWYMLTLLAGYGNVFVRRCQYRKCEKFFCPRTPRRLFCSDSCRALQHAFEEFAKNPKKFHKERAKAMKKNRASRKAQREGREKVRLRQMKS
jgi:hypothetical protein